MKRNGSEIILECLLEQGVSTIFGYPGGSVLNVYDALSRYQDRIKHVLTADERGATHAADGYARATGNVGVVLVTSGPGATNTVTGIATAYMDSVPLVVISGNVATPSLGLDSFQEIDITGITIPITKHNFIVKDISQLAHVIRSAFSIASSGRKGPVLVDIPKDITEQFCEYHPQPLKIKKQTQPVQPQSLKNAVSLLETSQRPLLYTGGGVISSTGANKAVAAFAEQFDLPVTSSLMGQGSFDQYHPRYLGMLGMHGTKAAALASRECDLLIAVGIRFSDRVTLKHKQFAPNAKILHLDIDPAEINKNIAVSSILIGDAAQSITALCENGKPCRHTDWMKQVSDWKSEFPLEQHPIHPGDVTPKEILETLCELTNGEAIITTEVGQNQMWSAMFYSFRFPRQFLTSGGLGTMGFGLGAAIGAKIARPEKTVINIAGDGSFQMNCNELVTLAKYEIPVIELVFNNQVLGMVRQWQRLFYGERYSQTTLDRPIDYLKLAEAYGIRGYRIVHPEDVRPILTDALASGKPALIEAVIDRDLNALPMVPTGNPIDNPILSI